MSVAIVAKEPTKQTNIANTTMYFEQQKNFLIQKVFYQLVIEF
jgi:hypothetical protein